MFEIVVFALSFIGLAIASFTDLKERIVPDKLNYFLVVAGLGIHAVGALVFNDAWFFVSSAVAAAAAFCFGWLLWKLGVWAGGDVKLLVGIAALNPFNPAVLGNVFGVWLPFSKPLGLPVFFVSVFVFSVFCMLPFGAVLGAKKLLEKKAELKKFLSESKRKSLRLVEIGFAASGLVKALGFFSLPAVVALPLLFVVEIFPKKTRIVAVALLAVFGLYSNAIGFVSDFVLVSLPLVALYFLLGLFLSSRRLLKESVRVSRLEEGMVPAATIVEQKGKVVFACGLETGKIIKHLKANNLQGLLDYLKGPDGRIVCSARRAAGLEEKEIAELKRLAQKGLIGKEIEVKLTAPFVPAVLLAYLLLNIVGDLLWNIVLA